MSLKVFWCMLGFLQSPLVVGLNLQGHEVLPAQTEGYQFSFMFLTRLVIFITNLFPVYQPRNL